MYVIMKGTVMLLDTAAALPCYIDVIDSTCPPTTIPRRLPSPSTFPGGGHTADAIPHESSTRDRSWGTDDRASDQ